MRLADLPTPALVVDLGAFDHNVATMGAAWPGSSLRPHVKAFKSTALARRLADAGHPSFCGATPREIVGMAEAGLGHDLLLANESLDAGRLGAMAACDGRVTVAVDSSETIAAAARAGLAEVLIDVNVGLPRCGCDVDDAGRLADEARTAGLAVRGVMGYEGHVVILEDHQQREAETAKSMAMLQRAHEAVGGDIISGGATATWDTNRLVTELQAGSFTLMDTAYVALGLPFRPAFAVIGTTISVNRTMQCGVVDVGLKALGMDHGKPTIDGARVWVVSDEHTTFGPPKDGVARPGGAWPGSVGDRVLVWPAHIDPTISQHQRMWVIAGPLAHSGENDRTAEHTAELDDAEIIDEWPVDLRHW